MLDLGLSKLAIIGVIALVVIGPEKLPRVARTAGALLGRAQRYINDVKSEVSREMDIADIKNAKSAFEDAARNVHSAVHEHAKNTEDHLNDTWRSMSPEASADSEAASAPPTSSETNPSGYSVYDEGEHVVADTTRAYSPTRRRNWRIKQSSPPMWFKRTQFVRTRVQSGAARVARHRVSDGASSPKPTRFL